METKKTTSILPGVIYSQLKDTYTFKEITETEELEEAFRLRYEVYSKSKVSNFLKKDNHKIDIDEYDLHSKHYGLYNSNKLMGYIRIVVDRNNYYNSKVLEVGQSFGYFTKSDHGFESMKKSNSPSFPFLSYYYIPQCIKSFYQITKSNKEGLIEAGRLIINEECRGLKTSIFFIECVIALYTIIYNGHDNTAVSCRKEHGAFYLRYGFKPIGDGKEYNPCKKASKISLLSFSIKLSLSSVPERFQEKLTSLADEFKQTNLISRAL